MKRTQFRLRSFFIFSGTKEISRRHKDRRKKKEHPRKKNISRFAQFARGVFDISDQDDEVCAIKGIEALEDFFREIGMPLKLREFGIENKASELAELCTFNGARTIKSYVEIDRKVAKEIFESCY